jgi:hypothetical protein
MEKLKAGEIVVEGSGAKPPILENCELRPDIANCGTPTRLALGFHLYESAVVFSHSTYQLAPTRRSKDRRHCG